jgi:hypothetical protein
VGLGKYLKKAFLNQWNLLAFLGAAGFALLSGHPDVFLPLVLAGEAAYVGVIGTHPKFQRYVDVQESKASRLEGSALANEAFQRMQKSLPRRQLDRFVSLRERCLALRQIAQQMRATDDLGGASDPHPLDDLQLSGLDRLLWIYLRLLYTQTMLERFFERTSEDEIRSEIKRVERKLAGLPPAETVEGSPRHSIRKALEDNLETCQARLANLQKARENSELIEAEIERLESKIRSITELAINRQDPQFVTSQVDQVASSLVQTEQAMNELQFATGFGPIEDAAPSIIPRETSLETPAAPAAEEPPRPRRKQTEDGIRYY